VGEWIAESQERSSLLIFSQSVNFLDDIGGQDWMECGRNASMRRDLRMNVKQRDGEGKVIGLGVNRPAVLTFMLAPCRM
jgi:hypothetical protein